MKILAITGSIRKDSKNTALLEAAKELAPEGVEMEIYIPDKFPIFSQDLEKDLPKEVVSFKKKIKEADALVFATPEHNQSVTAALKNAIEWGNRPWGDNSWDGKRALIMGAGGSAGSARSQSHLRQILVDINVWPMNSSIMVFLGSEPFDEKGQLVDEEVKERIKKLLVELVEFAKT